LKLDCEGAEYEILMGAPAAVLERVDAVILECHRREGLSVEDLVRHLAAAGFDVRAEPAGDGVHHYVSARRTETPREVAPPSAEAALARA
jgi:hypothetical protein